MNEYIVYNPDGTTLSSGASGSKDVVIDYNKTYPAAISDEEYTDVGADTFQLGTIRRAFKGSTDLTIYTAEDEGGTLLVEDTDYTVEDEDFYYLEDAGYHCYTGIKIINVTYQSGDLYVNYKAVGTYTKSGAYATTAYADQAGVPVGFIAPGGLIDTPAHWLLIDGSALDRTTYATLYAAITKTLGAVTISNGTPGVITLASGDWTEGQCIELTTTGGLPTGLSVNTNYYIHRTGAGTANVSASRELLQAGTYLATSSAGSGVHTARLCPWGISTAANFLLPDPAGLVMVMPGDATVNSRTKTGPTCAGAIQEDAQQGHLHIDGMTFDIGAGDVAVFEYGYVSAGSKAGTFSLSTANMKHAKSSYQYVYADPTYGSPRLSTANNENRLGMNHYIKYE